jgi:hypothetical protein
MISNSFINEQIELSKREKYTSFFIRSFIFKIVDKALKIHYGNNYSTRCLQSSAAISNLLKRFDIKSTLFTGSVCTIEVFCNDDSVGWEWSGFWNNEHHIFVISEFSDLIDLTISQLHLHPHSHLKNSFQFLPVWWTPVSKWPPLLKYLPEKPVEIDLPETEMTSFNAFLNLTENIADDLLINSSAEEIVFSPFISGIDSLNQLTNSGEPWLVWSKKIISQGVHLPDWIIAKEKELLIKFKNI